MLSIVITLAGAYRRLHAAPGAVSGHLAADRAGDVHLSRRGAKEVATRSPRQSSSRSTASRACSTCLRKCTNDGTYNMTVTFQHGINLNMAQVLVQNRVSLAMPMLPEVIRQTGVTCTSARPTS